MEPGSGRTRRFSFHRRDHRQVCDHAGVSGLGEHLGLGEVEICGHDFAMHAPSESYREVVRAIASDPMELGALSRPTRSTCSPPAGTCSTSSTPTRSCAGKCRLCPSADGLFRAHAKDPISSGRALDEFVEPGYWASGAGRRQDAAGRSRARTPVGGRRAPGPGGRRAHRRSRSEVLLFGAGGSNLAISLHLMTGRPSDDRPRGSSWSTAARLAWSRCAPCTNSWAER